MDWWIIVIIVIASLLALFIVAELVISLYVTHLMIHPYCTPIEEAIEKIRRGMHVLIREGTAAKNLKDLIPAQYSHIMKWIQYSRVMF